MTRAQVKPVKSSSGWYRKHYPTASSVSTVETYRERVRFLSFCVERRGHHACAIQFLSRHPRKSRPKHICSLLRLSFVILRFYTNDGQDSFFHFCYYEVCLAPANKFVVDLSPDLKSSVLAESPVLKAYKSFNHFQVLSLPCSLRCNHASFCPSSWFRSRKS